MHARIQSIRYLASREAQERYIINGTASEYLLPAELVHDALEFVRLVESGKIGSSLTPLLHSRTGELKAALEGADVDVPQGDLVGEDKSWAAVRRAAQRFLVEYDDAADRPTG